MEEKKFEDLAELEKAIKEKELEKKIRKIPTLTNCELEHRFDFHPANDEEKRNAHSSIRFNCLELAKFINRNLPEGREKSVAITKLEEVMFWANAGLARYGSE